MLSCANVFPARAPVKLCCAETALSDSTESREAFISPLYLPCDESSSISTFKGVVNLSYWIAQIHCIANLGNSEVTALSFFFFPALQEDVSLLLPILIYCNFRSNPNTSTWVTA